MLKDFLISTAMLLSAVSATAGNAGNIMAADTVNAAISFAQKLKRLFIFILLGYFFDIDYITMFITPQYKSDKI